MQDSGEHQSRNGAPDAQKNELKPWLKECWCIPPQGSAEFVCAMEDVLEDVLEVYQRQYADNEVLVCLDETSKQQMKETRRPRPAQPGAAGSYDYEYERNGVSNLFMLFAPLEGWRRVEVTDRRTKADWARVVKQLVDEDYPHKDRIVLVMDNLNTHHPCSLYEEFEPAEARRIAERLEVHYTPKHGSWLDMAEIEIGVMARQCLDRRIPIKGLAAAWQAQRKGYEWTGALPPGGCPFTHQSNTGAWQAQPTGTASASQPGTGALPPRHRMSRPEDRPALKSGLAARNQAGRRFSPGVRRYSSLGRNRLEVPGLTQITFSRPDANLIDY